MRNQRTAEQVCRQINNAYKKSLKAEGSNGVRRVNAQVADYIRDANLLGGANGIVAYPQWSVTAGDLLAGIDRSSHSDYVDLGTNYTGAPKPAHHSDDSINSVLRTLSVPVVGDPKDERDA